MAVKKKTVAKSKAKATAKTTVKSKAKATTRKILAKAKAATTAPRKVKAYGEPLTKTQLITSIAENTELSRKQVNAVFDELGLIIEGHLKKRGGAGTFTLPGMFKIVTKHKPAQKARKGIHPITKEPTTFKAKPASVQVKVRPLKKIKDMAQ